MPIYFIYTLQHAIYLATPIKSQIKLQRQRNLNDVIRRLNEAQDLIKQWRIFMKVPKNVPMSSLIVGKENLCEMLE